MNELNRGPAAVNRAIQEVRTGFPFPEIIDETTDTIKSIAALLQDLEPNGGRLLDIGCGAMDKVMVYQKMGYVCCATDDFQDSWYKNRDHLDPVLSYAQSLGIEVHRQQQPVELPWDRRSFDIVTIINVIEHLHESPRDLLNFAGTYIKPEGLLVVVMPNSVNLRKRLSVLRGHSNYTPVKGLYEYQGTWRGHTREYTLEETCQIVDWTGFEIASKSTFHGLLGSRISNPVIRSIFKGLSMAAPRLRDSLLVAARKPANWTPREPDPEALRGVAGHWGFD